MEACWHLLVIVLEQFSNVFYFIQFLNLVFILFVGFTWLSICVEDKETPVYPFV